MCLAIPVRVVALLGDQWVETEVGGIRSRTSIALIEEAALGDYLIAVSYTHLTLPTKA